MKNILFLVILPTNLPPTAPKVFKETHVNYLPGECKFKPTIYSRLFVLTGRFINALGKKRWKYFVLWSFYTLILAFSAPYVPNGDQLMLTF